MRKILVPFDGSHSALRAVRYAASVAKENPEVRLELLNVQDPTAMGEAESAMEEKHFRQMQIDETSRILQPAMEILDEAGVTYHVQSRVGPAATEIVDHVHETACDAIIMGTRGMSAFKTLMIGSVATLVVHLVNVPVTLIK